MKIYQKKILKFCPDKVVGEFINLGLFFFDAKSKEFCFSIVEEERAKKRIEVVFPNFSEVNLISKKLAQIEKNLLNLKMLDLSHHTSLDSIIKHYVIPIDDSALFFSETSTGLYPEDQSLKEVCEREGTRLFSGINFHPYANVTIDDIFDELSFLLYTEGHYKKSKTDVRYMYSLGDKLRLIQLFRVLLAQKGLYPKCTKEMDASIEQLRQIFLLEKNEDITWFGTLGSGYEDPSRLLFATNKNKLRWSKVNWDGHGCAQWGWTYLLKEDIDKHGFLGKNTQGEYYIGGLHSVGKTWQLETDKGHYLILSDFTDMNCKVEWVVPLHLR